MIKIEIIAMQVENLSIYRNIQNVILFKVTDF